MRGTKQGPQEDGTMTSAKQTKQSKQSNLKQERVSYLVSLIDAATLRRFTQKRATKLASIVLWGDEAKFKRLVDASKSGIAYADRFIAIADFLAAAGFKETKDLWGKSDYSCRRELLDIIDGLTRLSLEPVAQNGRVIVRNKDYGEVAKAYQYSRTVKELWIEFGADGMLTSAQTHTATIYPNQSRPAMEWVAVSDGAKDMLVQSLLAGRKVELPTF